MSTSDTTTKTVRRMFSEGPRVNSGLMEGSPVDASRLRYRAARGPAPRRGRRAAAQAVLSFIDHKDAAAGQHHAARGVGGAEGGRGLFERGRYRADDAGQRVLQRLEDFIAVELEAARHAVGEVAALHLDLTV